mmetsp:Transcript_18418/g.39365  ORF Transcript_18418/g.39365 Transcript_18418/m.39365 type:complete len:202 (-) Transcript_18418:363-968(-)
MMSPMYFCRPSATGICGLSRGGASASVSTFLLISCRLVITCTLSFVESFRKRGASAMKPVDIARLRMDAATMLRPLSPRMIETNSATSNSLTGFAADALSRVFVGCAARARMSSQLWLIPTLLNGESKNTESCSKNIRSSAKRAEKNLMGMVSFEPSLKTAFHSDSPWRMKTTFILLQLGAVKAGVESSGFRHFLSLEAKK